MQFLAASILLLVAMAANALDLADVAGTYGVDDAETQKHLEQEIAAFSKEGRSTDHLEELLREMKANPGDAKVTFIVTPVFFIMKAEGEETKSAYTDLKNAAEQVEFTVTADAGARQVRMRIRKGKEGMILMKVRTSDREMTLVLKKRAVLGATERLTLKDGRVLVGVYDESYERLTIDAGSGQIRATVKREDIVKREPVSSDHP